MRVSAKVDYALRAMLELAAAPPVASPVVVYEPVEVLPAAVVEREP